MTLAQKLQDDFKQYDIDKEVRIEDVNMLGYLLTEREVKIGNPVSFRLVEVVDGDKKGSVSFCYLFHVKPNTGYIMPRNYDEYLEFAPVPSPNKKRDKV